MALFADTFTTSLINDVTSLLQEAADLYQHELKNQGHVHTGNLFRSVETRVTTQGTTVIGELLLNDYFEYLERRLEPSKVPYRRGSGRRSSKLIQALKKYFQEKGYREKHALKFAFATVNKWKQEGRPTRASYRFATSGRRLRPLGVVLDELEGKLERLLELRTTRNLEVVVDRIGERFSRVLAV